MMRVRQAGASAAGEAVLQPRLSPNLCRLPDLRVASPQRPFHLLLVDDDHQHGTPLLRALRAHRHIVLYAIDGASGENLFRASQLEIDALVTRADMNRMCGFELARRLRRVRPEISVLLMCRHFAGPDSADDARERGYHVIEEPFTPDELCRRVTGLLASPRDDSRSRMELVGEGRPRPIEDENRTIDSWKGNTAVAAKEFHQWNEAKTEISRPARRRPCRRRCRW